MLLPLLLQLRIRCKIESSRTHATSWSGQCPNLQHTRAALCPCPSMLLPKLIAPSCSPPADVAAGWAATAAAAVASGVGRDSAGWRGHVEAQCEAARGGGLRAGEPVVHCSGGRAGRDAAGRAGAQGATTLPPPPRMACPYEI